MCGESRGLRRVVMCTHPELLWVGLHGGDSLVQLLQVIRDGADKLLQLPCGPRKLLAVRNR